MLSISSFYIIDEGGLVVLSLEALVNLGRSFVPVYIVRGYSDILKRDLLDVSFVGFDFSLVDPLHYLYFRDVNRNILVNLLLVVVLQHHLELLVFHIYTLLRRSESVCIHRETLVLHF